LTIKVENNLGFSSCAVPQSAVICVVAYFRRTELLPGVQEGSGILMSITNFIWPYLHQFFIDSHGLNGYGKPLERPFYLYQSRLEAISIGRDIRQINW